ncbi:MAG TPA: UdgX family uracil-DNA binding protein [Nitrospira sp.]|nr:UdgX family uracil-DNA binding protein [Nitrospira sp.]
MGRPVARSAQSFIPPHLSIPSLRKAALACTGCDLYKHATQTVFGEGAPHAKILFVGEQPGDQEDRAGHPFVGPAGKLLDKALAEAGIARQDAYVTNAVKHFKWEPQGKRRKHKKPSSAEVAACRPWLEAELRVIEPQVVVCLGATAAQSVFGRSVRVNEMRGKPWATAMAKTVFVTIHPSAILRYHEDRQRHEEYRGFVEDLARLRAFLEAEAA